MRCWLALLLCCLASAAQAQQQFLQFSTGSGFFIDGNGTLLTNAHVVQHCQSIALRTAEGDFPARLLAANDQRDLALLRMDHASPATASLRYNIHELKVGDALYLYGYPGEQGSRGVPSFVRTQLTATQGPQGEPLWLQLASASQQGNSGGPVLDSSGHVIAVATARIESYERTTNGGIGALLQKSDAAATLRSVQDFLNEQQITYYQSASSYHAVAESIIAARAHKFVAAVLCYQGTITR